MCKTTWLDKKSITYIPKGIFIVTPSIEQWLTRAKETPSPNEVRMNLSLEFRKIVSSISSRTTWISMNIPMCRGTKPYASFNDKKWIFKKA